MTFYPLPYQYIDLVVDRRTPRPPRTSDLIALHLAARDARRSKR